MAEVVHSRLGMHRAADGCATEECRVLQWIDAAQATNRRWARNALAAFVALLALLWVLAWIGR